MAFTLRQVSHSADGREIVRTSKVRDDELTIGRDPSCDVRLTDLAVALHHATLERVSPQKVGISAEKGLRFELNGRSVPFGQIDLAGGGDIRIASHLLRVMPTSPASNEVAIQIEKVTEGEVKLDKDDEERFSLAAVLPTKRVGAWAFTILVLGLFLIWPIKSFYDRQQAQAATAAAGGSGAAAPATLAAAEDFHADEMWSSGKLSLAHAALENDCKACHVQPFQAVRDESCVACHTQIHDHADPFRLARAEPDVTGLGRVKLAFQEAFNLPPGRCVECHTEHEGAQQMVPTAQQFCSDCHQSLDSKLPDTKLANAGDFGTAHPEFQPAVLMRWNGDRPVLQRVSLAADPKEASNLKFPHDIHLAKTGGVAQMARRLSDEHGFGQSLDCKDCHDPTADGVRFQPVNMEEDCGMCHSLAFDRQGNTLRTLRHGEPEQVIADLRDFYRARPPAPAATLGGMARRRPGETMAVRNRVQFATGTAGPRAERAIRAVFSPGGACFDCHQVEAPPRGSLAFDIRPVAFPIRYMHKGWFDHKAHNTESCGSCHNAAASDTATDLLLPDLASCRTCHGGENASNVDVPSTCAMCHDYHMDQGTPSMLLRQRDRGKDRDTVVANTAPKARPGGR